MKVFSRLELQRENDELRERLETAEETLQAIRSGEVDALMVGEQVYTLQGAEHAYRILMETMNEGAATVAGDGTVLYGNRRLAALLKEELQKIIGASLLRFVSPASLPVFTSLLDERQTENRRGEIAFQCADGSVVPVQISLSALAGEISTYVLVATDLTKQKTIEAELRQARDTLEERVRQRTEELAKANEALKEESREREQIHEALQRNEELARWQLAEIEAYYRTAPIGLAVLDRNLHFVRINERLAEMNGVPAAAHIGRSIHELAPALSVQSEALFQKVLDTGAPVLHVEVEGETPAQPGVLRTWIEHWYPLKSSWGTIVGINVVVEEATERKRIEKALRRSEERFRGLMDHMPGAIQGYRVDGTITYWNQGSERLYGYTAAEALGKNLGELIIPPELQEPFQQALAVGAKLTQSGEFQPSGEVTLLSKSGARVPIYSTHTAICSPGNPTELFCLDLDLSASKAAEQALSENELANKKQLRELMDHLEQRVEERTAQVQRQAEQLRALTTELCQAELRERKRLSKVLHDHIQQLLVLAKLQLEWIKYDAKADERTRKAAQDAENTLKEALSSSRSLTVELSPPILHESGLAAGLTWLGDRMLEKNQFRVRLRLDNEAEPAAEEVKILLFECVRELLFNALKHSGVMEAHVTLMRCKERQVRIIVRDEGNGFDPQLLDKRRSDEATFGLFSIQQRLFHLGGSMQIETAPGKGTHITLTAPRGEEALPAAKALPAPTAQGVVPKVHISEMPAVSRVLIVDDHKILREGLAGLLQFEPDIKVVGEADNGARAIELAAELKPDVVIMDVNLGGEMNGAAAARAILRAHPGVKVIALSMHIDADVVASMREAGAVVYLTKGGPSQELIAAIRACALS